MFGAVLSLLAFLADFIGGRYSRLLRFTQLFSGLQNAGLPVLRSLRVLVHDMPWGRLRFALQAVVSDVESGMTLSEAFARHPRVFNRLYVNMIRAGEAGGALEIILARLVASLEKPGILELARTLRMLGTMISSGVPILEALTITRDSCLNARYQSLYQRVFDSVREGDTIAQPFREAGFTPNWIINMIDVGEETGDLDSMLFNAADLLETVSK